MKDRYLEITFRKGVPFAAYLCFPRKVGSKSVRTEAVGEGLLVDYGSDGHPIGLEITAPTHVTPDQINAVLEDLGLPPMEPNGLTPLQAA